MSVKENIEAGVYKNPNEYPTLNNIGGGDASTADAMTRLRETRRVWQNETARLEREQFRQDLAIEHGVYQHHKEPKLWDMAWSDGHSGGLNEVANRYEELVELVL